MVRSPTTELTEQGPPPGRPLALALPRPRHGRAPHPRYPWGDQASHEYANYGTDQCCNEKVEGRDQWLYTAPVGKFPPNDFGLHDMHGNVFEWVEDPSHADYRGAPINGSAWTEGGEASFRVVRGGSRGNAPEYLRSAARNRGSVGDRNFYLGFRVGRTLTP
jgi:formylglycine-generating enzyme required for sulfatase activity